MSIITFYIFTIFINIYSQLDSKLIDTIKSRTIYDNKKGEIEKLIASYEQDKVVSIINSIDKYGLTALYYSVVWNIGDDPSITTILIDKGVNLSITYNNQTILHVAVTWNHYNTTKALLEKFKKLNMSKTINQLDDDGKTALDYVKENTISTDEQKNLMYNLLREYNARTSEELQAEEKYLKEIKLHPKEKEI